MHMISITNSVSCGECRPLKRSRNTGIRAKKGNKKRKAGRSVWLGILFNTNAQLWVSVSVGSDHASLHVSSGNIVSQRSPCEYLMVFSLDTYGLRACSSVASIRVGSAFINWSCDLHIEKKSFGIPPRNLIFSQDSMQFLIFWTTPIFRPPQGTKNLKDL